jgi:hypothetical protein
MMVMLPIVIPQSADTDRAIFWVFEYGRFVISAILWSVIFSETIIPIFAAARSKNNSGFERNQY